MVAGTGDQGVIEVAIGIDIGPDDTALRAAGLELRAVDAGPAATLGSEIEEAVFIVIAKDSRTAAFRIAAAAPIRCFVYESSSGRRG